MRWARSRSSGMPARAGKLAPEWVFDLQLVGDEQDSELVRGRRRAHLVEDLPEARVVGLVAAAADFASRDASRARGRPRATSTAARRRGRSATASRATARHASGSCPTRRRARGDGGAAGVTDAAAAPLARQDGEPARQLVHEHVVAIEPAAHAAAKVVAPAQVVDDVVADEEVDEHDVGIRAAAPPAARAARTPRGRRRTTPMASMGQPSARSATVVKWNSCGTTPTVNESPTAVDEAALVLLELVVGEAARVDAEADDRRARLQLVGGEPAFGVGRVLREQRRVHERARRCAATARARRRARTRSWRRGRARRRRRAPSRRAQRRAERVERRQRAEADDERVVRGALLVVVEQRRQPRQRQDVEGEAPRPRACSAPRRRRQIAIAIITQAATAAHSSGRAQAPSAGQWSRSPCRLTMSPIDRASASAKTADIRRACR